MGRAAPQNQVLSASLVVLGCGGDGKHRACKLVQSIFKKASFTVSGTQLALSKVLGLVIAPDSCAEGQSWRHRAPHPENSSEPRAPGGCKSFLGHSNLVSFTAHYLGLEGLKLSELEPGNEPH